MKVINRAYKYRFYPTSEQEKQLAQSFGCSRFVYNHFLRVKSDAYSEKKEKISYNDTSSLLTQLKKEEDFVWLKEVSSVVLQQSLKNLDTAYTNFLAKRTGYPKPKRRNARQSIRYVASAFTYDGEVTLAKQKDPLLVRWSRRFQGTPTSITVSKDRAGRYFVSFTVEETVSELSRVEKVVGIDVGIKDVCITSDGFKSGAPQYLRRYEEKLTKRQRELSKKTKGSRNRKKEQVRVARIHAKISDSRNDFNHKLSTQLIRENQAIVVESLNVKGMMKNHCLAKSIADASWGGFLNKLRYKAAWYGREFLEIDQWFPSSKTCYHCGAINKELTLDMRTWECPSCKTILDRDINAAKNIATAGLAGVAFGENRRLRVESSTQSISL
jgi:putative transposase